MYSCRKDTTLDQEILLSEQEFPISQNNFHCGISKACVFYYLRNIFFSTYAIENDLYTLDLCICYSFNICDELSNQSIHPMTSKP